jgi:hypothetical protein
MLYKLCETVDIGGHLLVNQEFPLEGIVDGFLRGMGIK